MGKHALLSASSSHKWLVCTPSAKMEASFPDEGSVYAAEGTDAHALAEKRLRHFVKTGKLMHKKDNKALNIVKPLIIFVGCMAVATLIELVTSYILEAVTGSWPWQTYADYKYNFQARIALSTSLRFGLGGTLFMYIVQPFYDLILAKPSRKAINIIALTVLIIVIVDCIYTFFIK